MSEKNISNEPLPGAEANPEEMTLQTLWTNHGRPLVLWLLVLAVVFGGWSLWNQHRETLAAEEAASLFQANTPDDLRNLALSARNPATAAAAWDLAAARFAAERRHEDALEAYKALESGFAGNDLAEAAALGIAHCQEALKLHAEAAATLDAWLEAHPAHYAAPFAILDAIRAHRLAGDFATARVRGEDYKLAHPDDPVASIRIDDALALVARDERAAAAVPAEPAPEEPAPAAEAPAAEPAPEAPAATAAE